MKSLFVIVSLLATLLFVPAAYAAGGSFVESTKSYRLDDAPKVTSLKKLKQKAHAWRGERLNFQIMLWSGSKTVKAQVAASNLKASNGAYIPSKYVKLDFLKFIEMNKKDAYAKSSEDIEMVPDMLNGSEPVTIKAGEIQPLWVGVNIPRKAKPGVYQGKISVKLGSKILRFPISIKVLSLQVPEVKDWTFNVNYWTHPQATLHYHLGCKCHGQDVSKYDHKKCDKLMWSDEHLALYKPTLELLRDAGLRSITVNLTKDPWLSAYRMKSEQHQTNYPYDEMIHWRRKSDGSFTFDFSDFEKYVKFCMKLGIDQKIECFSMLPWVNSKFSAISCFDEASRKQTLHYFKSWKEYNEVWSAFMKEFVPVLVKNGWFEKTVMGADERGLGNMGHVQKVLNKFKHRGKTLRISAAANKTHQFDDSIYHISMHGGFSKVANNKWSEDHFANWAKDRRKKGLISTWYTCTGTYPGNFGNSRPAESLFIGWYSAHLGADGYLRWAVDSWNDDPTKTTDHKVFETSDTFQIYPGDRDAKKPFTRSSVRFELFRQGVIDFEKIQVLRAEYPRTKDAIDKMLKEITRPARPAQYKGQSSVIYDEATENDFSDIVKKAQEALLKITLDVAR